MPGRKWIHQGDFVTLEVTVLGKDTKKSLEALASKLEDDLRGFLLSSYKGVEIVLQHHLSGVNEIPDRLKISLTPEKARELASFLLEATEGGA